jgi:hypothetical protein
MRKAREVGLAGVFWAMCFLGYFSPDANAQDRPVPSSSPSPWACVFLNSDRGTDAELKDDPSEERTYDASLKELYRLWCTAGPGTSLDRQQAADRVAAQWKALWYRDNPFNAEFHETGSFGLLVLIGVTHRVPKPMVDDPVFLHDWMEDCSNRCFMLYGDDDPGAHQEWLQFMRLRKEVIVHLGGDSAARQVLKMLKNAKLYPVN